MDILKGVRKTFLTIIFSRRFIRDRYIWTFATCFPLSLLIVNELLRPNTIEKKKLNNLIKSRWEYSKYFEDTITEEDWKVYQDYYIHHFNK